MSCEIAFKSKRTKSQGRNGLAISTGIGVYPLKDTVLISPITSRGETQNCYIEIPREDIPQLISQLIKHTAEYEQEEISQPVH